jgi:hypothetical protein
MEMGIDDVHVGVPASIFAVPFAGWQMTLFAGW